MRLLSRHRKCYFLIEPPKCEKDTLNLLNYEKIIQHFSRKIRPTSFDYKVLPAALKQALRLLY